MYEQEAREAVARGLAWIKANAETLNLDPSRIDPDRINVENDRNCVLASAGGRDFQEIMIDAGDPNEDGDWLLDHGFAARWDRNPITQGTHTATLCQEWRRAILADRGQFHRYM